MSIRFRIGKKKFSILFAEYPALGVLAYRFCEELFFAVPQPFRELELVISCKTKNPSGEQCPVHVLDVFIDGV